MSESTLDYDNPDWAPLRSVLPLDECDEWMWMTRWEHGGRVIESYKHIATRRYLHLDQTGQAWRIRRADNDWCTPFCEIDHEHVPEGPSTGEQVPLAEALEWALS